MMPSLKAVPHLSYLMAMGLASPQMGSPTALRGPCDWGDEVGVPTANGATCIVFCLAHPLDGGHVANSGYGNTSTSTSTSVCTQVYAVLSYY